MGNFLLKAKMLCIALVIKANTVSSYVNINMQMDGRLRIAQCLMQDQNYHLSFYLNSWLTLFYCILKIHYSCAVKAQKVSVLSISPNLNIEQKRHLAKYEVIYFKEQVMFSIMH